MIDWTNPSEDDMRVLGEEMARIGNENNLISAAIAMIAMLQVAMRHPMVQDHPHLAACVAAARLMQHEIAHQSPLVAEYLETGWCRELDR